MTNLLLTLISLIATFSFGLSIVNLFSNKSHFIFKFALSYLVGLGLTTFVMFIMNWFGLPLNELLILSFLIISTLSLTALKAIVTKQNLVPMIHMNIDVLGYWRKISRLERVLIICLFALFLVSLINNLYWPVRTWDALTLYDFRGKVFAEEQSLAPAFVHRYYLGHGMMISLSHAWMYLIGVTNPMFIYTLLYISFIVSFYFLLKPESSKKIALFLTTLLAFSTTIFDHSTIAYSNLPYTIYIVLGYLFLYKWLSKYNYYSLIMSAVFVGLSTWVRDSEPFWITPIIVVLIVSIKRRRMQDIISYLIIVLPLKGLWGQYRSITLSKIEGAVPDVMPWDSIINNAFDIGRLVDVIKYVINATVLPHTTLFTTLLLLVLAKYRHLQLKDLALIFLVVANIIGIIAGVYITSLTYEKWTVVGDSVTRMSMFFAPLSLFAIGVLMRKHE